MKKLTLWALLLAYCMPAHAVTPYQMSDSWEQISIYDVKNPADLFGEDWAALAAGNAESMNAMTIGWGQFGTLWQRPVVTVYVAPERYTNEFMDRSEYFTVTAFPKDKKDSLLYIGTHSGRDEDKLKKAGLTPEFTPLGNPIFKEATLAIECKILYKEPLKFYLMPEKTREFYNERKITPHIQYIGEVINVWQKSE